MVSKLYFGGDVNVTEILPEHAKPGESFEVKIEIEKGDREGFAKWQQAIPKGFTAIKGQTETGTFSFKNQEIKIIWMALPNPEKFVITYTLQSEASLSGEFDFNGKFSYIEENERKEVVVDKQSITISIDAPVIAAIPPKETEVTPPEEENQPENTMVDQQQSASPSETMANNAEMLQVLDGENIKIRRSINHISEGFYEVDLEITKNNFGSFGKIEEFIPPNYTASSIDDKEGIFSFSKNVMKIMWMTLPQEDVINIKYGLQSTSDELDSATVFGVFSYLEVDKSRQLKLKGSKFKNYLSENDAIAENLQIMEKEELIPPVVPEEKEMGEKEGMNASEIIPEESTETIADEMASTINDEANSEKESPSTNSNVERIEEETNNDIPEVTETASSKEDVIESITNIPSPETAISYRVQIAASKKEVQQQYFVTRHNVTENVTIQSHEGWYKYTIGSYNVYKAARDKRNQIWGADNKINDAFVTAYNEGVRISVQEALMVSKQKWYN